MTLEEASQVYCINQEIRCIKKELWNLMAERKYYKPNILSDMPKGNGGHSNMTDDYLERQGDLEDMLRYSLRKLQEERKKFEEFLASVEDAEMRLILRLRCVNNMRWEEIGSSLGMDRRTASRKFYHFFKVAHNAHDACGNM